MKPIYLEPVAPRQANISAKDRHPWFQIYRELEDEGMGLPGVQKTIFIQVATVATPFENWVFRARLGCAFHWYFGCSFSGDVRHRIVAGFVRD